MKWAGYVACTGDTRTSYRIVVRKPEGKRPDGGRRHDDIKKGYDQIDCEFMDRFNVTHKSETVYWNMVVNYRFYNRPRIPSPIERLLASE
jgi:hypothetical protein